MKSAKELIIYKDFKNGRLFYNFTWILENYKNDYYNKEDIRALFYECFHDLLELAGSHGFEGNLWHNFLTFLLINNENAYSTASESGERSAEAWRRSHCMIFQSLKAFSILISIS